MASPSKKVKALVLVLALAAVAVELSSAAAAATTHNINWGLKSYSMVSYKYGDYVRFVYTRAHDLVEVSQRGYTSCRGGVIARYSSGALIRLKRRGVRYFICQPHCTAGMKIKIKTF